MCETIAAEAMPYPEIAPTILMRRTRQPSRHTSRRIISHDRLRLAPITRTLRTRSSFWPAFQLPVRSSDVRFKSSTILRLFVSAPDLRAAFSLWRPKQWLLEQLNSSTPSRALDSSSRRREDVFVLSQQAGSEWTHVKERVSLRATEPNWPRADLIASGKIENQPAGFLFQARLPGAKRTVPHSLARPAIYVLVSPPELCSHPQHRATAFCS